MAARRPWGRGVLRNVSWFYLMIVAIVSWCICVKIHSWSSEAKRLKGRVSHWLVFKGDMKKSRLAERFSQAKVSDCEKTVFQTQQGRCTDEPAMAVRAGTGVCKFKPDQLPAWAGE